MRNVASSNVVTIEDVTSRHNGAGGMNLLGPDITVKDSTASYNVLEGIRIESNDIYFNDPQGNYTTKVFFEGKVSSHNNSNGGMMFSSIGGWIDDTPHYAEITVKGDVSLYRNHDYGLVFYSTPYHDILFTVEENGSFSSCHHGEFDVFSSNEVSFFDEGTDGYRCETVNDDWIGGQGLPVCVHCPDTCDEED